MKRDFGQWIMLFLAVSLLGGCASYGVVQNKPGTDRKTEPRYDLKHWGRTEDGGKFAFILTFSGGGTRAAAMAYGVLEELRDTPVVVNGQTKRLLDEVDHISSVSGGSFTAAYYGLHGDGIFDTFKDEFLTVNVEGHLTKSLFNPFYWFSKKGRTDRAIEYYNKVLFHDATFADMMVPGRPMIVINTSDLAYGVRFSFVQDYFDFLCTDLLTFPVANAVTASSAVPVVFNPVLVENYAGCPEHVWPPGTARQVEADQEFALLYEGMQSYNQKEARKYIHFVDGGITDNMGLRAMTDVMAMSGGPAALISKLDRKPPSHVVFISVNASTEKRSDMDETTKQPSMLAAMNAMTDVQLHRYNAATVDLVKIGLERWTAAVSTPEHPITPHFISISFEQVPQPQLKLFLNKIPTSFNLNKEQVDTLIKSARTLLQDNPEYQKLLAEIAKG